ncbi:MAG: HlyD family efflux transporter periplasmic adaptor subunit [Polyangiaceae bacterium]
MAGCRARAAPEKARPAEVSRPVKESELGTIALTEDAARNLGVETAPVTTKTLPRQRTFAGEVVPPAGGAATVTAPVGGSLAPPTKGALSVAGDRVTKGQLVLGLVLTPADRIKLSEGRLAISASKVDADLEIDRATAEATGARDALQRAEQLFAEGVGTAQTLESARTRAAVADAALRGARARSGALDALRVESTSAAPLRVESPMTGKLFRVHVVPGQAVAAGAPLFEVVAEGATWIKVPLYAGDLPRLAEGGQARVSRLGRAPGAAATFIPAQLVDTPSTSTARSASVELYFEVDATAAATLRIGERVDVGLPLRDAAPARTVPWSAIVHDYHGGTWVYLQTAPRTFARRRVEVRYVVGADAALESGPADGALVVAHGAAELFGVELGNGQ